MYAFRRDVVAVGNRKYATYKSFRVLVHLRMIERKVVCRGLEVVPENASNRRSMTTQQVDVDSAFFPL